MEFAEFFEALHGYAPYRWQQALADHLKKTGRWPTEISAPTGAGKSALVDIAVWFLAWQLHQGHERRTAALRIFFVVDRRIVVDAAYERALKIAKKLTDATDGVLKQAAELLRGLQPDAPEQPRPLEVAILRGGMYRDNAWATAPTQPLVVVSTVDQVGSRLLFRGYGVSAGMRGIHAGLIGCDSLVILDEAHLSEPFQRTLRGAAEIVKPSEGQPQPPVPPLTAVVMSATLANSSPGPAAAKVLAEETDTEVTDAQGTLFNRNEPSASPEAAAVAEAAESDAEAPNPEPDRDKFKFDRAAARLDARLDRCLRTHKVARLVKTTQKSFVQETLRQARDFASQQERPVIGIVVNRVRTARQIFEKLQPLSADPDAEDYLDSAAVLLTGRIRPFDRDELLFRTPLQDCDGQPREGYFPFMENDPKRPSLGKPLFVVATQTVEVGADLNFDYLVTEVAPLASLKQRFGRLRRSGSDVNDPQEIAAAIVATKEQVAARAEDPVYGDALKHTWNWLEDMGSGPKKTRRIDFGIDHLPAPALQVAKDLAIKEVDTPRLRPIDLDLLAQTNPPPRHDPEVPLYLHGIESSSPEVQIVWRADLPVRGDFMNQEECLAVVTQLPPMSMEACPVPLYAARQWLRHAETPEVADIEGLTPIQEDRTDERRRPAFAWRGKEDSRVVSASQIRPGDVLVVPTSYGGYDEFGWNPPEDGSTNPEVRDVADLCVRWTRLKPTLRLHPEVAPHWLPGFGSDAEDAKEARADLVAAVKELAVGVDEDDLRDINADALAKLPTCLADIGCIQAIVASAKFLEDKKSRAKLIPYQANETRDRVDGPQAWLWRSDVRRVDPAEVAQEIRPGGTHVLADEEELLPDQQDASSFAGELSLAEHRDDVVQAVQEFAAWLRLPQPLAHALYVAAMWHDEGKRDELFQRMLRGGDELSWLAADPAQPLAKSNQRTKRERQDARVRSGLPAGFRHEALSYLLLKQAFDSTAEQLGVTDPDLRDLVLFLVGSHHGVGRGLYPVWDEADATPIATELGGVTATLSAEARREQALFRGDSDWCDLVERVHRRWGWWRVAWFEAVFRLADHRGSARGQMNRQDRETDSATPQEAVAHG